MKPRIVICRSNPIAPDPRVEKEARALKQAGYEITLIGWDRTGLLPKEDYIDGNRCYRLQIKAKFAAGMMNFPQLLRWQWGLLKWLFQYRDDFDLIHACDFDTVLPAIACRNLFGKKVVYDIFDFYADHLRSTPGWIKRLIRIADITAINNVDGLILVDDSRREQVKKSRPRRSVVIYNSPEDIDHTDLQRKSGGLNGQHNSSKLHIVYVGLIQKERGLFELLSVLEAHPEWSLDLAGFGGDEGIIIENQQDLQNVSWFGRVSYQKALELSISADTLIATYDPSIPNHRYSSPNKVFEAMLLSKPIIVAKKTNMDHIINQEQCGLVVNYGDRDELEAALYELESNSDLRVRLGFNGRRAYDAKYSWQIMQDRLISFYADVTENT